MMWMFTDTGTQKTYNVTNFAGKDAPPSWGIRFTSVRVKLGDLLRDSTNAIAAAANINPQWPMLYELVGYDATDKSLVFGVEVDVTALVDLPQYLLTKRIG